MPSPADTAIEKVFETLCEDTFQMLVDTGISGPTANTALNTASRLNGVAKRDVLNIVEGLSLPVAEPLWTTDFADPSWTEFWKVYSAANGNAEWGQNDRRAGEYHPPRQSGEGICFDFLNLGKQINGKTGRKTSFVARTGPRTLKVVVRAWVLQKLGFWPCPLWLTAILRKGAPIRGGWAAMEIDHYEDFGVQKGRFEHGKFSTATHIGFDQIPMAARPDINSQSDILLNPLGRNHWHTIGDLDKGFHDFGLEVSEVPGGLMVTWTIDGDVIQTLDTRDFIAKGYTLNEVLEWLEGWNIYICTQASKTVDSGPEDLYNAMVVTEATCWAA